MLGEGWTCRRGRTDAVRRDAGVDFGGDRLLMEDLLLTFERGEVLEVAGLDDRGAMLAGWLKIAYWGRERKTGLEADATANVDCEDMDIDIGRSYGSYGRGMLL